MISGGQLHTTASSAFAFAAPPPAQRVAMYSLPFCNASVHCAGVECHAAPQGYPHSPNGSDGNVRVDESQECSMVGTYAMLCSVAYLVVSVDHAFVAPATISSYGVSGNVEALVVFIQP